VNSVSDSVDKSLVRIGREIDDDTSARRNGAGDFDIKHYLAVSAIGGSWVVLSGSDGNSYDGWRFLTKRFEVGRNICLEPR
jgi:hypothetical protein